MNGKIEILHLDGEIAVVVKPSGISAQTSAGDNMVSALEELTGGAIYPVHRLDKETQGVMVYARTANAAAALSEQFGSGSTVKYYLTVLLGSPTEDEGVYSDLLYHDARRNKSYVVACSRRGVREASLSYRVFARDGGLSLAAVRLMTGRTHQIRVQFASRGTPVYGDRRYGGRPDSERWGFEPVPTRGIALTCASLSFRHPATGKEMKFEYAPGGGVWDLFDIAAAIGSFKNMK